MAFVPPGPDEQARAVGPLGELPPDLRRAFTPGNDFDPVPGPGPHDWLSVARERGQGFERFARVTSNRPGEARPQIGLQPVGELSAEQARLVQDLLRFGSAFFMREVRLLPPLPVEGAGIASRRNRYTDDVQLNTRDILRILADHVPPDAWGVLGVSFYDLYPHEAWSFVFGEALLDERVGVFSLARYDPRFYGDEGDPGLVLRRGCKVLAHEACHMLGLRHCVFFNCLMNGSNSLAESDRRPLHLCPVDLRKLQWSLGLDLLDRYRRLQAFWTQAGAAGEAEWIERRLGFVERGASPIGDGRP
jgi:archaemetzincin